MESIEALHNKINDEIERRTQDLKFREPAGLYLPVNYSLEGGGKRLRPLLLMMSYNLFSESTDVALPAAIAVEVFHNFTLLHDDIMDRALVRRNKATVHKYFSENSAILSGDAMAFISYQFLMECRVKRLFDVMGLFTQTALQVCEGQQFDMDFETRKEVPEEEYLEMIRLKTAVLLGCSLKSGALLADAPDETTEQLYEMGISLGLAFQIQDDWLDAFGIQKTFGKKIGGDILAGKKTWLMIKAAEKADKELKKELFYWFGVGNESADEKINSVIRVYQKLGIDEIAREKINFYFRKATETLNSLPVEDQRKIYFNKLINNMIQRSQ